MRADGTGRGGDGHRGGHRSTGLVGRESVLGAARAALWSTGAVLLAGPAGIGRSALTDALAVEWVGAGTTVLHCAPAREERELPYVGLNDLLGELPEQRLDALLNPLADAPRAALRAALLRGRRPSGAADRLALRVGVLHVLRALAEAEVAGARAGSLLLVLDGLQWLDAPTAEVLRFVLRRAGRLGIRVLATERTALADVGSADAAGVCPPETVRLAVPLLAPSAVAELLAPLPAALLRGVQSLAAGNPRYALELARTDVPSGGARPTPTPIPLPAVLRREVRERLPRLAAPARRALLLVAAGARPTPAELRAAGGWEDPEPVLVALLRSDLIELALPDDRRCPPDAPVADGGSAGRVLRFVEPLVRAVLLAETSPAELAAARRDLAAVTADPGERARLRALAGGGGPDEPTAARLATAAARARSAGRAGQAAELALLAVQHTPLEACHARTPHPRAERLLTAAQFAHDAGHFDEAEQLAHAVLATTTPEPPARAPGRSRGAAVPSTLLTRLVEQPMATPAQSGAAAPGAPRAVALLPPAVSPESQPGAAPSTTRAVVRPPAPCGIHRAATTVLALRTRARVIALRSATVVDPSPVLIASGIAEVRDAPEQGAALEAELRHCAAEHALLAGRTEQALREARSAVALARAAEDDDERLAACLGLLATVQAQRGESDLSQRTLAQACALARAAAPAAPAWDLSHRRLAFQLAADQPSAAVAGAVALLARADREGGLTETVRALALLVRAQAADGSAASALASATRLAELLASSGEQLSSPPTASTAHPAGRLVDQPTPGPLTALALHAIAVAELAGGQASRACDAATRAASAATARGDRRHQLAALGVLGEAQLLRANSTAVAAGVEALQEARRLSTESGLADAAALRRLGTLAEGLVALGEYGEAAQVIAEARRLELSCPEPLEVDPPDFLGPPDLRAPAAPPARDPEQPRRTLPTATLPTGAAPPTATAPTPAHPADPRPDPRTGEFLAELPGELAGAGTRAALDRAEALVRAGLGQVREGAARLRGAADRLLSAGLPLEAAGTLVALSTVERRSRHRSAAREALLQARDICAERQALPLLARVERELERLEQSNGWSGPDGAGLTASEHRVAGLAADGATNREVAAALFVSVKTVEGTLSRVYRKLGVRSRTALARALAANP
ncbi:AAA family ATPase [Kitasatospora sp. NPDC052896]|uniref:AAA family ATPase n=1 Tax=Kitasatospora sp. NPDC052896 TaxID=3364061 RepID=UPI0037C522D6